MSLRVVSLVSCAAALAVIAGCNPSPDPAQGNGAFPGGAEGKGSDVGLPPSVKLTRIFRCADRDTYYADLLADDLTARLRRQPTGPATELRASAPGEAFVAEQYSLSADGESLEVRRPGKAPVSCVG